LPCDEAITKLSIVPQIVKVASVWVDQVPGERRPPIEDA
jgi:hypothetical protein